MVNVNAYAGGGGEESVQLSRVLTPHSARTITVHKKRGFDSGGVAFINLTSACVINSQSDQPLTSGDSTIENVFGCDLMKSSLFYLHNPPCV